MIFRTCYVTFRETSNAYNSEIVTGINDKRMLEKVKKEERSKLFPLDPSQKVCENTLQSQDPEVTLSHLYTVNGLSQTQVSIAFIAAILTSVITQGEG